MTDHWALVNNENICVAVNIASAEWIESWSDPSGELRYVPTEEGTGYAGVGFTLDEPTGWFIPPADLFPEDWVFDRDPDVWAWVDPNPPEVDPDTPATPEQ